MPAALQELLTLRNALVERDRELAALRLRNLQRTQHAQTAPTVAPKAQHEGEGAPLPSISMVHQQII